MPVPPAAPERDLLPSEDEILRCVELLRSLERLPPEHPGRRALEQAVSQAHRGVKKRQRRQREVSRKRADREARGAFLAASTEVRGVRMVDPEAAPAQVRCAASCYVCKGHYTQLHPRYPSLCPPCAELNLQRREQRADLSGRRALVTGGRTKVGFQLALKLLRDGADVLVTTRFPRDAALRFSQEADAQAWQDRLRIVGLDLRHLPRVHAFAEQLLSAESHLDILVNNAAQTVRPTPEQRAALDAHDEALRLAPGAAALLMRGPPSHDRFLPTLPVSGDAPTLPPELLAPLERADGSLADAGAWNSWVMRLHEVPLVELLETHVINAVAPFVLTARLKPLLLRSPHADRHVVHVSAVEGQFARENKTAFHPHTNMAKAALNMMTRTSAADYARDGIFMNSVDTGWLTNENPHEKRLRMEAAGFTTPLDVVDGAARVYDPIVQGVLGRPVHGLFLKDYRSAPW